MNERINDLFDKALDEVVPNTWTNLTMDQLNDIKNKFAELIVLECVREFVRKTPVSVNVSNRARHVMNHFGVDDTIEAAESLHSDKGYSLGTPEAQEAFDSKRGYKL